MKKKNKPIRTKPRPSLLAVAMAVPVGGGLAFLGGRWIAARRIEYWTGSTEYHHFLATPDASPAIYWALVSVFCAGAAVLLTKSIVDLIGWLCFDSKSAENV